MVKPNHHLQVHVDEDSESDISELLTGSLLSTTSSAFDSPLPSTGISPDPLLSFPLTPNRSPSTPGPDYSPSTPEPVHPRQVSRPHPTTLDIDPALTAKIRRWIFGIAIVDFDVDDGPVVSSVHPPLALLPGEASNIAFSSFPDSPQFDQGSRSHSFRLRATSLNTEDGFVYGYSNFTQRRNEESKRGYEQRSLVILSHLSYPALFSNVVSLFGALFQVHGPPMLEAACHNIASWSDPVPGATLELGFLGSVIPVELPRTNDEQQLTDTSSFGEKYDPKVHVLASSSPFVPPPLLLFEASLSHLWSIWECLVLGEPILVFGSSPGQTSQAIWWLRDLLRPIPHAGDIRPYFTIHDSDHTSLVNKRPPISGLILGVTNPFFERSCVHWPHILSLGRRVPLNTATGAGTSTAPAGPAPGWKTKVHKRYISKDRPLLKRLEEACRGTEKERMDLSLILRRHFCGRTTELLIPLTRYLNTLIPTPAEVDLARRRGTGDLRLKPFNSVHFFASLKAHGAPLPFKSTSKRTEFYQRWLKTSNFGLFLAQHELVVQGVLNGG